MRDVRREDFHTVKRSQITSVSRLIDGMVRQREFEEKENFSEQEITEQAFGQYMEALHHQAPISEYIKPER